MKFMIIHLAWAIWILFNYLSMRWTRARSGSVIVTDVHWLKTAFHIVAFRNDNRLTDVSRCRLSENWNRYENRRSLRTVYSTNPASRCRWLKLKYQRLSNVDDLSFSINTYCSLWNWYRIDFKNRQKSSKSSQSSRMAISIDRVSRCRYRLNS